MLLYNAVPQILALMIDLEEEADWAQQDEPEDEDTDRYNITQSFTFA